MTSSSPGDSMTSLHPDDLFLVNRDVDGTNTDFETYKVPYSEVSKAFIGPIGPDGDPGATGSTGIQGPAGTNVKVLGYFETLDKLHDFAKDNFNSIDEGDMYVVGNDYALNSYENPGINFCDSGLPDDTCKKNVAYVWAIGAGDTPTTGGTVPTAGNRFVRIAQLTGDRGSTGPYYDELTIDINNTTDQPNGQYDYTLKFRDLKPTTDLYTPLADKDLLVPDVQGATGSTGPYYDTIYTSVDSIEGIDDSTFKKDYRITFASSNASDPEGVLQPFQTLNLVGATGPGVGQRGEIGPMGLFYDSVSFTEDAFQVTDDGDTPYGAVTVTYSGDPNGPNASLTPYTSGNVRGPRGPGGEITNLNELENLLINLYPPGTPEGDDAPWVHKGKNCGEDFYDENVYGQKTFAHTIGFDPCDAKRAVMHWKVGGGRDFKMFFKKNYDAGGFKTDGFALQRTDTGSPGLTVLFETGSGSPKIGVKVATPAYDVDVKAVVAASQFIARSGDDAGKLFKKGTQYRKFAIESNETAFSFKGAGSAKPEYKFLTKLLIGVPKNEFKIVNAALPSIGGNYLRRNTGNSIIGQSSSATFALPSLSDESYSIGEYQDKTLALGVIKALKPRLITKDNQTHISLCKNDLTSDTLSRMSVVFDEDEANEREGSIESMLSLLILSVQKLEERISVLEATS